MCGGTTWLKCEWICMVLEHLHGSWVCVVCGDYVDACLWIYVDVWMNLSSVICSPQLIVRDVLSFRRSSRYIRHRSAWHGHQPWRADDAELGRRGFVHQVYDGVLQNLLHQVPKLWQSGEWAQTWDTSFWGMSTNIRHIILRNEYKHHTHHSEERKKKPMIKY